MNDFEDLKNDWKSIQTSSIELNENSNSLAEKLKKLQRKILLGNIITSITFIPTFIILVWLWTSYEKGSILFYGSLVCMAILLVSTLVLFWYRTLFWKTSELDKNVKSFAKIMIKKLYYYKWITNIYMPIYSIVLTLIVFAYYHAILKDVSFWFSFTAYTLTLGWVIVIGSIYIKRKIKKNKKEIDPILSDLKQINDVL
ncbi:hypothetical protein N8834_00275 [bacterium]|nr:hypothetical protein [bacterium]